MSAVKKKIKPTNKQPKTEKEMRGKPLHERKKFSSDKHKKKIDARKLTFFLFQLFTKPNKRGIFRKEKKTIISDWDDDRQLKSEKKVTKKKK